MKAAELNSRESQKRVLIFASKLGYQTRAFDEAAAKLGVELSFVTDRCHQLDDPWRDGRWRCNLKLRKPRQSR